MTLARAWSQRLFGASLLAVAVPGAVLAALAVVAVAGGLGRLGDLGQVFSGPQLPPAPAVHAAKRHFIPAARLASRRGSAAVARPTPARRATGAPGPAAASPRQGGVSTGSTGAGGASAGSGGTRGPGSNGGSGGSGGTSGTGGSGPGPGGPSGSGGPSSSGGAGGTGVGGGTGGGGTQPAPPRPSPILTDRVIGVAGSVTGRLPAPVGPTATQVLRQAGGTVDRVLAIPSPSTPPLGSKLP